jgi:hypothetical protein
MGVLDEGRVSANPQVDHGATGNLVSLVRNQDINPETVGNSPDYGEEYSGSPEDYGYVIDEDELLKALKEEIDNALDDNNHSFVVENLEYYRSQRPAVDNDQADEGNEYSSIVAPEVLNAIEATLAEIMPGFYGDQPAEFLPLGRGDEDQAVQESKIVTHVIFAINKGYVLLNRSFKDSLICGDGFIKVLWDGRTQVEGRRIRGVAPEMLPNVLSSMTVTHGKLEDNGQYCLDALQIYAEGQPLHVWVPTEEVLVNRDHEDVTLDTARLVVHRRNVPASDLVAVGVPKEIVDELAENDEDVFDTTGHESTKPILVCECYYRIDADGDGIAELRRDILAGGPNGYDRLLLDEPWEEQPLAHGVPFFGSRAWRGISLTDRLKDIQVFKSDLVRQILDAGWRNLRQRVGLVERMVNMDDWNSSRNGGGIRIKDPNALVPLDNVQIPHQIFLLLEVMDKMRRESGGGAIDTAPQAQEMGADSAHGLERIMSAIEQANAMVAKNLAETLVVEMYQKTHRLLRRNWPGIIQARANSTWISQTPAQWPKREMVGVAVGLSTGERLRIAQGLQSILTIQDQAVAAGQSGITVGPAEIYRARMDYCRYVGIKSPDRYWIDPNSPQAQQAAQRMSQQALQDKQQQLELQIKQQEAQLATMVQIEELKNQSDNYRAELKHLEAVINQRLQLIDMNAKYDKQPVPDQVPYEKSSSS